MSDLCDPVAPVAFRDDARVCLAAEDEHKLVVLVHPREHQEEALQLQLQDGLPALRWRQQRPEELDVCDGNCCSAAESTTIRALNTQMTKNIYLKDILREGTSCTHRQRS